MTVFLSQRDLQALALAGEPDEGARALAAALDPDAAELAAGDEVHASDLVRTYRVRVGRWSATGVPRSVGLPGVLAALEGMGGGSVLLVRLARPDGTALALLSPDRSTLLAGAVLQG